MLRKFGLDIASGQWLARRGLLAVLTLIVLNAKPAAAIQSETEPARKTFSVEAGSVRMQVGVSKTIAAVADPVELEFSVFAPPGIRVFLPKVPAQLGSLDVVSHDQWPDIPTANGREWRQRLVLESIQTGELTIPSMEMGLSGNGDDDRIRTPEIPIIITSVLEGRADPASFRDIQNVVDVPVPQSGPLPWVGPWVGWTLGAAAGFGGLIALVVPVIRRRRWMSPYQWTVREMAAIRENLESENLAGTAAASRLAATLRTFLEMQYGFAATTSTTDQLLTALRERIALEEIGELSKQLQQLELVTYAGLEPDKQALLKSAEQAIELVRRMDTDDAVHGRTKSLGERPGGHA